VQKQQMALFPTYHRQRYMVVLRLLLQ